MIADFDFEIKRKLFHVSALIFPILYMFLSKLSMVVLLFFITVIVLSCDVLRHNTNSFIAILVNRYLGNLMRVHECNGSHNLSGISSMITGFFITTVLFSKGLTITSWFIVIISDALATLVGMKIGVKLASGKSKAGSVAFASSALMISLVCYVFIGYKTSFTIMLLSSCITAIIEHYAQRIKIDDNLLIALTYNLSTNILVAILGL